jgi:hypothetical protein
VARSAGIQVATAAIEASANVTEAKVTGSVALLMWKVDRDLAFIVETVLLDRAHRADDSDGLLWIEPQPLSDRILTGPEALRIDLSIFPERHDPPPLVRSQISYREPS